MSEAERRWLVIQKKVDRPHHPHLHPQTNHDHPHSFLSSFHFYLTKLKDHPLFPKLHSQIFLLQQFQMPGTIQVSVLGLMDLPSSLSSSSSSSSISVQVSMGKREYQTWDKGDFSFPVLTLRDNLVITLHDTEGNELSRTGVETLSVIEKGFVDEFFPLEGGGRLHLTLQFILTKEDRKRIQDVRETALKKKQVELLTSSSQRHLETAALASVGGNVVSSSLSLNHEVTDSQEGPVEMEAASNTRVSIQDDTISMSDSCAKDPIPGSGNEVGIPQNGQGQPDQVSQECPGIPLNCQEQPGQVKASDSCTKDPISGSENEDGIPLNCQEQPDQVKASDTCTKDPISGSGNEEGTPLNRPKKPDPNNVDGSEGTSSTIPLSRNLEVHHTEASQNSSEKIKTKLPSTDIPMKTLSSLKALDPQLGFTKSLVTKHSQSVSGTSQKDQIHSPENQGAMKRTSSVKNMISAFESNLSQKFSSPIHALTLKSQLKKPMTEGTLKGPNVQVIEKNRIQDIAEELSSSSTLESQEVNLQRSSTEQKDEIGSKQHKEEHVNEPITLRDELDGNSAEETATVLKRVPVYFPCIEPPSVKSQQSKTTIEGSLKGLNVEEVTSETSKAHKVAETAPSLPSIEKSQDVNLQQSMTSVRGVGDEIGLKQHKEENVNEHGTLLEEFAGTSAVEIGATSRGMPDKHVDRDQSCSASKDQQDSALEALVSDEIGLKQPKEEIVNEHGTLLKGLAGTSAAVEIDANSRRMPDKPADRDQSCNASKDQQDSDMLDIPVSSNENNQSVVYSGDEQYSFDSWGTCTFLDDSRRLCITTGSKQVMDLVCSCDVTAESNQKKILSSTEALNKQNRDGNACKEVNKNGKGSCNLRKSKLERTADVGASGQLIGQAVRVAIMVAFGTFVFIMREKK